MFILVVVIIDVSIICLGDKKYVHLKTINVGQNYTTFDAVLEDNQLYPSPSGMDLSGSSSADHLEIRNHTASLPWNPSTIWDEIKRLANNVTLYPATYDVERVRRTLQNSKLVSVRKLYHNTALKWMMVLDGNQTVVFKPRIQDRSLENSSMSTCGCEYPEYEITAFAINRMLGMRNMPFITGRRFNWFTDILPVADHFLKKGAIVTKDGDVCIKHSCACKKSNTFCFPQGDIAGAVILWLDTHIYTTHPVGVGGPWTLYNPRKGRRNQPRYFHHYLPGDSTFCRWFRTTNDYYKDKRFVNILDIAVLDYLMLSYDSKDNYIINDKNVTVNIFIDRGKSFYKDHVTLLAPVYQCCKIRKVVYKSLMSLSGRFEEAFQNETRTDALYPCLDHDALSKMESRLNVILKFVEVCENRYGLSNVLLDI